MDKELRPWLGGKDKNKWFETLYPPLCCRECEQKALIHARELWDDEKEEIDTLKSQLSALEKEKATLQNELTVATGLQHDGLSIWCELCDYDSTEYDDEFHDIYWHYMNILTT